MSASRDRSRNCRVRSSGRRIATDAPRRSRQHDARRHCRTSIRSSDAALQSSWRQPVVGGAAAPRQAGVGRSTAAADVPRHCRSRSRSSVGSSRIAAQSTGMALFLSALYERACDIRTCCGVVPARSFGARIQFVNLRLTDQKPHDLDQCRSVAPHHLGAESVLARAPPPESSRATLRPRPALRGEGWEGWARDHVAQSAYGDSPAPRRGHGFAACEILADAEECEAQTSLLMWRVRARADSPDPLLLLLTLRPARQSADGDSVCVRPPPGP